MTTEDYTKLSGNTCRTRFYSVVRYGGPEVITNCNFKIIVGIDEEFNQEQIIEVWVDFLKEMKNFLFHYVQVNLREWKNINLMLKKLK